MRPHGVRARLAEGGVAVNGWLSIAAPYAAEAVGHSGVHSVTVDLQHGMLGFSDALAMLQAISATPATPMVRAPGLDPEAIMHLLDAGAYGVVCPMVSTPEQAAALVSACRYPPRGTRSFGPSRGLLYGGPDYVAEADATVMAIPMIETAQGVERIDEILAVPGVDMVYVGPNDLAFAMDGHVGAERPRSEAGLRRVLAAAIRHGVPAGVFCASGEEARDRARQGFRLVTPGNDMGHLTRGMKAAVATALSDAAAPPRDAVSHGY